MNKMTLKEYIQDVKEYIQNDLLDITLETLYMVGLSGLIATIFALIFGSLLYTLRTNKIKTCQVIYKVLDIIVNIFRSIPFSHMTLYHHTHLSNIISTHLKFFNTLHN